jgi:CRP/FNR family transcriptional regulator
MPLATVALFADLDRDTLALLERHAVARQASTDETLFRAGDAATALYVVLEGSVRVYREDDGRRFVLHVEGAGGALGEIPLFAGDCFPATAVAAEPTRYVMLSRAAMHAAIASSPVLATRLLERLARHLLLRLDRARTPGAVVTLGLTQSQLAEELGTVREVLVRELRALRTSGIIAPLGAGRFEIVDLARLRALASSSGRVGHGA